PRQPIHIISPLFHKYTLSFIYHSMSISLIFVIPIFLIFLGGFLSNIGEAQFGGILALLGLIGFILLIPLLMTKLPAVTDPNGDKSLKAALERGKKIFWPFLGTLILILLVSVGVNILVQMIAVQSGSTEIIIMVSHYMSLLLVIPISVTQSHYYMKSEYFME
ncbi:MAG: hypothetical protein AAF621_00890, partial [Pseudomonadota bacterium]